LDKAPFINNILFPGPHQPCRLLVGYRLSLTTFSYPNTNGLLSFLFFKRKTRSFDQFSLTSPTGFLTIELNQFRPFFFLQHLRVTVTPLNHHETYRAQCFILVCRNRPYLKFLRPTQKNNGYPSSCRLSFPAGAAVAPRETPGRHCSISSLLPPVFESSLSECRSL